MLWGVTEGATKKLRSNIRRSTETGIAVEMRSRVTRQGSRESTDGSTNSNSSDGTCVQPTHRGPRPPPWSYTEPGAGQENLQLDFQPRRLGSSVPLSPTILFPRHPVPGPQSCYGSSLLFLTQTPQWPGNSSSLLFVSRLPPPSTYMLPRSRGEGSKGKCDSKILLI